MKKIATTCCLIFSILITSIVGNNSNVKASEILSSTLKKPSMSNGVSTWDCIYFGNYYQSDATGKKKDAIKWRVLDTNGKEALLISDSVLDIKQYVEADDAWPEATWETCDLRDWLNSKFIKKAFNEKEQEALLITKVTTPDNKIYGTVGGNSTEDKIYLPSREDMLNTAYGFSSKWLEQSETRRCTKTNYFCAQYKYIIENKKNDKNSEGEWIPSVYDSYNVLRTSGHPQKFVSFVDNRERHGRGNLVGNPTNCYYGVRPMLRIDLTNTSLWKYAGTVASGGKIVEYQYSQDGTPKIVKSSVNLKVPVIRKIANIGNYKVKINIEKVDGATGYEYRFSNNKKLKKSTKKIAKKTSITTSKLNKNKKYYFSVRAYKNVNKVKQYSDWSKVKSIKTSKKKSVNKPSLSSTKISMSLGGKKTLKMNYNSKKIKWSIISGKNIISLSKKTNRSVYVKAKKKGTAKIQAKIGKKKYYCKVNVKKVKSPIFSLTPTPTPMPTPTPIVTATPVPEPTPTATVEVTKNENDIQALQMLIAEQKEKGATVSENLDDEQYIWEQVDETVPELRLVSLNWDKKQLSGSIDFAEFSELGRIQVNDNRLTEINTARNTKLTDLHCASNNLTNIDIEKNSKLQVLDCSHNSLTVVDVSKCLEIFSLTCSSNLLETLRVSDNSILEDLHCEDNYLTQLPVEKMSKLLYLDCSKNQIVRLDLSNNKSLGDLICDDSVVVETNEK